MPDRPVTLHLLCGKAASGKSTLAAELGRAARTVVIAEDAWLAALFGDRMETLADYVDVSAKLRTAIAPHVVDLLRAGVSVVLDFPANTQETRAWMRGLIEASGAAHRLHLLEVSDETCKARLRARNAGGAHPFSLTEEQFDRITRHFAPPLEAEGFTIVTHRAGERDR